MSTIRITKEFRFEAAHALKGYDGVCRNIHGHSYELSVTLTGHPIGDDASPKKGMVVDFSDLKKLVKSTVIDHFDHSLILPEDFGDLGITAPGEPFSNIMKVGYQPTSENMLIDFAARIRAVLPGNARLFSLKLRETASSYAEWYASDNV
jgi:6-pyruvoyltetrahydropterin/6-carboxytetrahydropterin synthase